MKDYTISESFILPSKGLVYENQVAPEITLRSMTTNDEMKRLSVSDYQYKPMSEVLDSCIVSGPNMSTYDMCIGDYQFLLYKLRIITYGADFTVETKCPFCGFFNKDTISLDDFPINEFSEDIYKFMEVDLPVSKSHVKLKMQTPRSLDLISIRAKEAKQRAKDKSLDFSMIYTLISMIDTVDGNKYDQLKLESWVRELPMMDTNMLFAFSTKLNDFIGVNVELEEGCALCGSSYKLPFRPGAAFFRPEINI